MQLCNVTLRLGGSLLHTVPKVDVTPAEILVMQHIHGADAVVEIRPTMFDKKRRSDQEFNRLAAAYDKGAGSFSDQPGSENKSVLQTLFPGALKKLPLTLEEIGLGDPDATAPGDGMDFAPHEEGESREAA